MRADTLQTTPLGRNLTPLCVAESVNLVLGSVDLDPASDEVANDGIGAYRFYSIKDDGFSQDWTCRTLFLNPPGKSTSQGKEIKAAHWFQRLGREFMSGTVDEAIGLVYRGGSIGGLPYWLLADCMICLTCRESKEARNKSNKDISGSGRLNFSTVNENDEREVQDKNSQSSMIFLLSDSEATQNKFANEFRKYGAIFKSYV